MPADGYDLAVQSSKETDPPRSPELPALLIDSVTKSFSLPTDRTQTLKERALHPIRSAERSTFDALKSVSLHVDKGEFFGLVGRNGSGKSTMLKCIAGIYTADQGAIYHDGVITSFIELGVGFNPELAALDNVVLNATLLGLEPDEARERYPKVMDFAELWEFENLKLKNYSSGMYVRLAFSVMLQVDADILLIDEVLAVGDAAFQQKCFDEFQRMREEKKTIVFVTHDMDSVKRFCDRAALLDHGELVAVGSPVEVGDRYLALNFGDESYDDEGPTHHKGAHISDIWVEDQSGERVGAVKQGAPFKVQVEVEYDEPAENPWTSVALRNEAGTTLVLSGLSQLGEETGSYAPGEKALYTLETECWFAAGRCNIAVESGDPNVRNRRYFQIEPAASFVITGGEGNNTEIIVPHAVTLTPLNKPAPTTEGVR